MYKILSKINLVSKILQSPGADIGKAVVLIKNTMENMLKIRDNFNNLREEANSKALQWNVTPEFSCKRTRKVKNFIMSYVKINVFHKETVISKRKLYIAVSTL